MILKAENTWEWIAVIVVVSVFAPLSEEILFRGYIYHSLREKYSVIYSIIAASLLFGCMHYDLFRLLPLTLGGIALNVVAGAGRFPLGIYYHAWGLEFYEYPGASFDSGFGNVI